LRQIATATKISVAALEALERNDVSKLPGGIFSRAFVRSYAVEVGLDPEQTVREFVERFHPEAAQPADQEAEAADDQRAAENRRRMGLMILGIVLVSVPIVLLLLWVGLRWENRSAAPADGLPALAGTPQHETASARDPRGEDATRQAAPGRELEATAGAPAPPAQAVAPVTLELQPSGPCWVSLTVDGERVMSRLMQAGEREVRQVHQLALLEVGDAGVFTFSINGRLARSLGAAGEKKQASITPQNYTRFIR
jgi:cytoskeletal protein RodZ